MEALERLKSRLAKFESSDYESLAIEMRTQFAAIINTTLKERRWTQSRLAEAASLHESQISSLVHGDENCTIGTMAKVLFALKVRASITSTEFTATRVTGHNHILLSEATNGQTNWITLEKAVGETTAPLDIPTKFTQATGTADRARVSRSREFQDDLGGHNAGDLPKGGKRRRADIQYSVSGGTHLRGVR